MVSFGISLQLEEYSADLAVSTAQFAEDLGFSALFVNDHYMKPGGGHFLDAYLVLSAIAAQTKQIRIGTSVTPLPLRPVPFVAKMVATLDIVSQGRFIFGAGAGWYEAEFEACGVEFLSPGERVGETIEGLKLMKRMWTEEVAFTFKGSYNHVKNFVLLPKPKQKPYPPILVGSRSPRMCRALAKLADGWIPQLISLEEYEQKMKIILADAERLGRGRNEFIFAPILRFFPTTSREEGLKILSASAQWNRYKNGFIVGSPEECAQRLQKYVDLGSDLISLRLHQVYNIKEQLRSIKQITRMIKD